jgi:hypothetical protein
VSEREIWVVEPEGVGVDAAEEAFDHAKLDHATHVDGHSIKSVELDPGREGEGWFEARVEGEKGGEGYKRGVACAWSVNRGSEGDKVLTHLLPSRRMPRTRPSSRLSLPPLPRRIGQHRRLMEVLHTSWSTGRGRR